MTSADAPDESWSAERLRECARERGVNLGNAKTKQAMVTLLRAQPLNVVDATERSIADAVRRGVLDAALQAGPIQAIRALARKIDLADAYLAALAEDAEAKGLRPPSPDNVSLSAYLKYADSLRLLPGKNVGEQRAPGSTPKTPKAETPPPADVPTLPQGDERESKLSKLRGQHQAR